MNNSQKIIDNLSPDDALVILQRLAAQDEKLATEIASLALAYLSHVDAEEITGALRDDLEGLTPEKYGTGQATRVTATWRLAKRLNR